MPFGYIKKTYVVQFLGYGFLKRIYNFVTCKNVYDAIETETYVRYEA